MLETRHLARPEAFEVAARSQPYGSGTVAHGFTIALHRHPRGQLVYAASGMLATETAHGIWLAPADRITWTPPGFEHAHRFYGDTEVHLVNVPEELCGQLADHPAVYAVTPLLRAAVLSLTGRADPASAASDRLRQVVLDELVHAPDRSLHLPEPSDDRLRAVTGLLRDDPARPSTLGELGRQVGASERTLSRLFAAELGMGFHRWRTILRIHHALVLLSDDHPVTETSATCGWANPTSFIEAFTAVVGTTPGRYQAGLRAAKAPPRATIPGRRGH